MSYDAGFALRGAWSHVGSEVECPPRSDASEGLFSAIEAIAIELHENRAAQAALRRTNELFASVIDGTSDVIFVKDLGGRYLLINRAGTEFFAKPSSEILGKTDAELFGPEEAARIRQTDRDVMTLASVRTSQDEMQHGRKYIWLTTKGPYRDHDGNVVGIFGISRDITEHIRADEERQGLVAELERAVASRDEFLAIASHELKSPLAALRLHLENTLRQLRSHADVTDPTFHQKLMYRLEASERQLHRLSRHVGNLMDVTRVTAHKVDLHLQPADLSVLTQEVISGYHEEARWAGCEVELHCEGPVRGSWDPLRVEQIITNLFTNALKYGAGKPIVVKVGQRGAHAVLEVRDHGMGIPKDQHARIFERFERAPGAKQLPGLGLGLWIVRAIVEAHRGTISVRSRVGEGSTFTVKLPREAVAA